MTGATTPANFFNVGQIDQLTLSGNATQDEADVYGAVQFVMDEKNRTAEDILRAGSKA